MLQALRLSGVLRHAPPRPAAHLDVAVDAVLGMQVDEGIEHLPHQVGHAGLGQRRAPRLLAHLRRGAGGEGR